MVKSENCGEYIQIKSEIGHSHKTEVLRVDGAKGQLVS